jgi:hypothetical protein
VQQHIVIFAKETSLLISNKKKQGQQPLVKERVIEIPGKACGAQPENNRSPLSCHAV